MCRLRTNFARLGDPLQGLHKGKQANLASLVGNAPLSVAGATTSPGGGSLLSAQLLNSKSTQGIAPLKPPPPGEVPKAEGVHFLAPKARLYGFFPARAVVKVLLSHRLRRGRWWRSHQGGTAFPSPARAVCLFSHRRKPGCMVFPATSYQPLATPTPSRRVPVLPRAKARL